MFLNHDSNARDCSAGNHLKSEKDNLAVSLLVKLTHCSTTVLTVDIAR